MLLIYQYASVPQHELLQHADGRLVLLLGLFDSSLHVEAVTLLPKGGFTHDVHSEVRWGDPSPGQSNSLTLGVCR